MKTRGITYLTLGLVVGAATGYFAGRHTNPPEPANPWQSLQLEGKGIAFATEALFGVEIALPEIQSISGQAKFLARTDTQPGSSIGYRIEVKIANLDSSKIPEKYRKRVVDPGGWEIGPVEQVVYEATFTFFLKDQDGFVLQRVVSQPYQLTSGRTNMLQDVATAPIPLATAARVHVIKVELGVNKCSTCQPNS